MFAFLSHGHLLMHTHKTITPERRAIIKGWTYMPVENVRLVISMVIRERREGDDLVE